jgi:hypothetical protein
VNKFDPEVIKAQIEHLTAERNRLDQAIVALQTALHNMQGVGQGELKLVEPGSSDITLHDAVKRVCINLIDGITRQRVLNAIERMYPYLKPKSPSVAASLINLTKGDNPMLHTGIEGQGRNPAFYSTEENTTHRLSAEEIEALLDESATRGTGGWQSLYAALQKEFNKATGSITLTAELRCKLYRYYHDYGSGGWQNRTMRIFRRELPHLFVA